MNRVTVHTTYNTIALGLAGKQGVAEETSLQEALQGLRDTVYCDLEDDLPGYVAIRLEDLSVEEVKYV